MVVLSELIGDVLVAGSPDGGIVRLLSRLDPDVELMLRPYVATPLGV
jgi:hypothetical protein